MAGLIIRDNRIITPSLRNGAPTTGPLNGLVMTGAGSYFTEVMDVGTFNELIGFLKTTAQGGTNPTLDVKLQYSPDGKTFIDSGDAYDQITTTSNGITYSKKFTSNFGKYIRFRLDIGGTSNPTYTVTLNLSLKDGSGSDGVFGSLVKDSFGFLKVTLGTALSKAIDSITSRPEGTIYTDITASANAIRTGTGILVGMYVNSTSSGTIKIYDSLTQATTVINNTITPAVGWHNLGNAAFNTGLSVTIGGTLDVTLYYIITP